MNERESYIEAMLEEGKIRPKTGHLLCEKLVGNNTVKVEGIGDVAGVETASGLVLVTNQTEESASIRCKLLVIMAAGKTPYSWKFRWFGKERDWKTDWISQGIEPGVVIGVRAVAGIEQDKADRFIEVRYDEIAAIGQIEGDDDMLPAPGWVFLNVELGDNDRLGGLIIRPEMKDVLEHGAMSWGTVTALPRGYRDGSIKVGDRVGFDRYKNEEYLMLDDSKIRAMPLDEILCVANTLN